ncbi:MAG: glycosyltransferase [Sphingobium sp.]
MDLTRGSLDSPMVFLAAMALISSLLILRTVPAPHEVGRPNSRESIELFGSLAAALFVSTLLTGDFVGLLPVFSVFLAVAAVARYYISRLSMPGILWITVQPLALGLSGLWSCMFILEQNFPLWVEILSLGGICASLLMFGIGFGERFAREAVLTHELWRHPITAHSGSAYDRQFAISVHLACYAEPPEVVMATMDHLAAQTYGNFEVLICDNNTKDEALWRPLERHCATLNARLGTNRFRFFHVAPLRGAKAGALNFCLGVMAPETEIVAVIDADYLARPGFLSSLAPFFKNAQVGYVQTPHDYRSYAQSTYHSACYWEYMPNNKVDMPGVSEYGAAFTIGTMCLLRAKPLRDIGGWAEWCLTEDSEVSVRMRAAGYNGVYLGETFGRGLIPETFDDYKKQRFRWTAGPVQQLRRHWRLFLPAPFAPPMPGWSKLLEILRCVAPLQMLIGMVGGLLAFVAMMVPMLAGHMAAIDIPNVSWTILTLGLATTVVRTWHRYSLAGCTGFGEMMWGEIARLSLSYIILVAGISGLSSKPLAWRRTPKFAVNSSSESPFATTMPETILGMVGIISAIFMLSVADYIGQEFAWIGFLSLTAVSLRFLCAPLMSALAIRHVNAQHIAQLPRAPLGVELRA